METFGDRQSSWQPSQRVRAAVARPQLAEILNWAFTVADGIMEAPDDTLADLLDRLRAILRTWEPIVAPPSALHPDWRSQLRAAFDTIRTIARAIATGHATEIPVQLELLVSPPSLDRAGRPQCTLRGQRADGVVWTSLRLFSEVPRSLIRRCALAGCDRIYVASKTQKFCLPHQAEARRQVQRKAERAFRARAKKKKATTTKKKKATTTKTKRGRR
jgi:hypothetical protein